jgi:UDP-N-acetylmuramyl tripeptide synthase
MRPVTVPRAVAALRLQTALGIGSLAAISSRVLRRGSGEVVGGKAALRLYPDAVAALAAGRPIATVSGTNGKTTTTRLLAAALAVSGPVASNVGGANMTPGIVTALAARPRRGPAALEVDELYLPRVAPSLAPRALVLLNITRDQLDRSNETRRIASLWRALGAVLPDTTVVANVDDPLVTWAALGFGHRIWVAAGQRWQLDATVCPACGGLLVRGSADAASDWYCTGCDLRRPEPSVVTVAVDRVDVDGRSYAVNLALPGLVNTGNAAMALAAASVMGSEPGVALARMRDIRDVQGRYREIQLGGRTARLLLAKNPAGWLELLELLDGAPPRPALIHFHARVADGRDPSWIWDVPLERLAGREVHLSGERAEDVGVRLAYAGVPYRLHSDAASAAAACAGSGPVDVLATYTAFRELLLASGTM